MKGRSLSGRDCGNPGFTLLLFAKQVEAKDEKVDKP